MEKQVPTEGPSEETDAVSTKAEGGLQSDAAVLDEQARRAQPLLEEENLLPKTPGSSSPDGVSQNSLADSGSTRNSP